MNNTSTTLSLNEVMHLTGLSAAEIADLLERGRFPNPLPLGPWVHGWSRRAVEAWLATQES